MRDDDLKDWKNKHCNEIKPVGEGENMICTTPSGIEVHKGYGCKGCPYA